jgi:ABC-2 type transport system permease protein
MNGITAGAAALEPRSPARQAFLFQWLRWRLLGNTLRVILRRGQVRVITILLCSLLIWASLFALGYFSFKELRVRFNLPLNGDLLVLVFDLMFVALTVLLVFSTGIILYSSLFQAPESSFLLSTPMRADQIFAYKFQGAVAFSSWAFILLGSPILIAYGLQVEYGAPWYFYAVLPLFFFGFVLLPGSLGALACLFLVNLIPKHRKQVLILFLLALALGLGFWVYRWLPSWSDLFVTRDWLRQLLGEISLIRGPLMPAHWIAQGLQSAALGELENMFFHLALVWANGLFLYVITAWIAGRYYRRGFNRVATGGTLRRRYGASWLDRVFERQLFFLAPQTRLLIVKDFRTFRRDPAQWAQVLIFMALAFLYFFIIGGIYEQEIGRAFQNGISFLNLMATSFLMCAYTGRFIFPMLSLEGRKFWILGLLPLQRRRLLWGKFAFSATGCILIGEALVVFSNVMFLMPGHIIVVHAITMAAIALGLSGLSVGLGACLPNFRESDPSKIAVGFGGTLNLVAGLLLLVAVIFLVAGPWHLALAAGQGRPLRMDLNGEVRWSLFLSGLIIGACAVWLPMRAGTRALERMEF